MDTSSVTPLEQPSRPLKIAIVGFAASSQEEAPYTDDTWQVWGLNELWRALPRRPDGSQAWDAWFDCHPRWSIDRRPGHVAWLHKQPAGGKPIYMQEHYDDIPASVPMPKDELLQRFGPYFTCGPAWMVAMAIHAGAQQIGIWGIDMLHATEYAYQRPCVDYYIGYARGMGIPVYIPEASSLGKAKGLYGYDTLGPKRRRYVSTRVKKRKQQISATKDDALRGVYTLDGCITASEKFGGQQELTKRIQVKWQEAKLATTPDLAAVVDLELEAYRREVLAQLAEQRDQALQLLYATDGALQELSYWSDVAKHLEREGV